MTLKIVKKRNFIKKAIYPGGKIALREFIKKNLQYPKEAIRKRIEGDVLLKFKVNPNGKVIEPIIIKGIGHGCDQEAIRIIKTLKFQKKINRKVKVTTHKKITINFRLPQNKPMINYIIIP